MSRLKITIRSILVAALRACAALLLAALPLAATAQVQPYDGLAAAPPAIYPTAFAGPTGETLAPVDVNPLPNLPRPADQPRTLFEPAQAGPPYGCPDRECPYLQDDPLLDHCGVQQPGFLFDVELDYLDNYVVESVGQFYQPLAAPIPANAPLAVAIPMAHLDWAVSPRFEMGYRLPSGFGEFDFAYRFFDASGSNLGNVSLIDPVGATESGAANLTSHLQLRVTDFDYASRETSLETMLGPGWGMKWRLGLRYAEVIFNSRADEPPAGAIGGFDEEAFSNLNWGIGPHGGVEVQRRWKETGLGFTWRVDTGLLFGKTTQRFSDLSTAPGGSAAFGFSNDQQTPMLSTYVGLDWRPPSHPDFDFLAGYTNEYWWNVGRLSDPDMYNGNSAGEFGTSGVAFRVQYNY